MRDILLTLIVFGSLPFILKYSYVGIYVWSWLSYMNPHRLTWGFAFYMPFAQIVAVTLLFAILMSKEKKDIPVHPTLVLWILFILWMTVTTLFAIYQDYAFAQYIKVIKIQIPTFMTMMLIRNRQQLNILIWVIVCSIGFFSLKGGIFTILTAGTSRVWGPPGGFIEENNALAVATLMTVPLMIYLRSITDRKLIRLGLAGGVFLSLVSVLGSQSRGALLTIIAVGVFFWLKSRSKFLSGLLIVILAFAGWSFMPQSWHDRMETIQTYEEDTSAMGRINAWGYAINLASHRLTGGGFESWSSSTFRQYAPNPDTWHAAHSIYFAVLGDHGWPGLIIFLLILLLTWLSLSKIIRQTRDNPGNSDFQFLAKMVQVSLVAYCAGGAFLSLAYFDLPWHLIAMVYIVRYRILNESRPPQGEAVARKANIA